MPLTGVPSPPSVDNARVWDEESFIAAITSGEIELETSATYTVEAKSDADLLRTRLGHVLHLMGVTWDEIAHLCADSDVFCEPDWCGRWVIAHRFGTDYRSVGKPWTI